MESSYRKLNLTLIITGTMCLIVSLVIIFSKGNIYDTTIREFLSQNKYNLIICLVCFISIIFLLIFYFVSKKQDNISDEITSYSNRLKKVIIQENDNELTTSILDYETSQNENSYDDDANIQETDAAKSNDNNEKINALELMLINLEDIKEFYTWSQKQAKAAFALAVIMCILGFALMTTAVIFSAILKLDFPVSFIPAIGGAISEIVAATALVVYKNSLTQLNHYHKALHEDERFLSSINLLSRFSSTDMQDNMLQEIIKSEIQMNLSELKNK